MDELLQLKKEIIAESKRIGIDKIGFASVDIFSELKQRLITQQQLNYASGFEKGTVEERTEPKKLMYEAQSIISIALAYPTRMNNQPKNEKGERRGLFCRASWGVDYHVVLRERLEKLAAFIETKHRDFRYKIMVDTGELSDRAVAERAGIGFIGKNTALITDEFGSFVYLGEMITNIPFRPDVPVEDSCGDCRICLDACPTGALVQGGQLNAQNCLSYVSQTKEMLAEPFRDKLGNRLYGCDTCQLVCPRNKHIDFHLHEAFEPEPDLAMPKLVPLLQLSNRKFKDTFGHVSGSWRGKNPLHRNALIALAHFKEKAALDEIIAILHEDVRPIMRGTAAWAIGKVGTEKGVAALHEAREKEREEKVIEEIERALQKLETK